MGRGAGPGRRVTLHTGRAGGRLRPVLVEMLGERWGTASGGAPAPDSRHQCTWGGDTHPPLPPPGCSPPPTLPRAAPHPGTVLSPRTCGATWVHPTQLMPSTAHPNLTGRVAPAPGAGHSRTQLSGRSRRASHWFPVLALNAGTCSPTVPSHAGAGQPGCEELAIPTLAHTIHPNPASLPGRGIPQSSSSSPAASGQGRVRTHTLGQGESIT